MGSPGLPRACHFASSAVTEEGPASTGTQLSTPCTSPTERVLRACFETRGRDCLDETLTNLLLRGHWSSKFSASRTAENTVWEGCPQERLDGLRMLRSSEGDIANGQLRMLPAADSCREQAASKMRREWIAQGFLYTCHRHTRFILSPGVVLRHMQHRRRQGKQQQQEQHTELLSGLRQHQGFQAIQ